MAITQRATEVPVNGRYGPISTIKAVSEVHEGKALQTVVTIGAFTVLPEDKDEFLKAQEELLQRYGGK